MAYTDLIAISPHLFADQSAARGLLVPISGRRANGCIRSPNQDPLTKHLTPTCVFGSSPLNFVSCNREPGI